MHGRGVVVTGGKINESTTAAKRNVEKGALCKAYLTYHFRKREPQFTLKCLIYKKIIKPKKAYFLPKPHFRVLSKFGYFIILTIYVYETSPRGLRA